MSIRTGCPHSATILNPETGQLASRRLPGACPGQLVNQMRHETLNSATRSRSHLCSTLRSTCIPGLSTTAATRSSPSSASGTAKTAASAMAGWPRGAVSISPGTIFSPPRLIIFPKLASEVHVARLIHEANVARAEPAIGEKCGGVGCRVVQIPRE